MTSAPKHTPAAEVCVLRSAHAADGTASQWDQSSFGVDGLRRSVRPRLRSSVNGSNRKLRVYDEAKAADIFERARGLFLLCDLGFHRPIRPSAAPQ